MRGIERWLHQHIFKVGWLLTQNFKTTTILYYTFFLPGVVLHEVVFWLAAGIFNVRADRAIKWPEAQEIGELRLNFVQISPRAGVYRRAIIAVVPLVVGLSLVWWIASTIFDINAVVLTMSSGNLDDVAAGFAQLVQTPDFWLWFYILFTVSNTMYPTVPKDLRGWRTVAGAIVVIIITLFLIGIGNQISQSVAVPLGSFLSVLQNILLLIIGSNLFMTLVLGSLEYALEATTGRSATFKKGKMIVMSREAVLAERQKAREREQKQLATFAQRNPAAVAGPPSIYHFALPIPGGPGEEAVTQPVIQIAGLPDEKVMPAASSSGKSVDLIEGEATLTADTAPAEPVIRIGGSLVGQPRTPETPNKPAEQPSPSTSPAAVQPFAPKFPIQPPVAQPPAAKIAPTTTDTEEEKAAETAQAIEDASNILAQKVTPTKPPIIQTSIDEDEDELLDDDDDFVDDDESDEDDDFVDDDDLGENDSEATPAPRITAQPPASLSPFARPLSPTVKPVISDDEDDDLDNEKPATTPATLSPAAFKRPATSLSPFSQPSPKPVVDHSGDNDSALAKPILPTKPAPFKSPAASFNPFIKPTPKSVEDKREDNDNDSALAKPAPFKSPTASFSPLSRPSVKPVISDDDDDDNEESLLRRGRVDDATDAVSDLFKDLTGDAEDSAPDIRPTYKPTTSKPSNSLFGNVQKPASSGSLFNTPKAGTGIFKSSAKDLPDDDADLDDLRYVDDADADLDDLRYVDDEEYANYDDE